VVTQRPLFAPEVAIENGSKERLFLADTVL